MKQVNDKYLTYSIIIPVSNRPEGLQTTLRGVFATRQPENTVRNEVVVVNDGSWPEVSKLIATHPQSEKIREVTLPEQSGPATARNRGVEEATGEWLVFFDDGMEIPEDWLEKAMDYAEDYDYVAFNVKIKPRIGEGPVEKLFRISIFRFESLLREESFCGTGGLIVKKGLFEQVGGFNEQLLIAEDLAFGKEVKRANGKQIFVSTVKLWHEPKSLQKFIKERERKISQEIYLREKFKSKGYVTPKKKNSIKYKSIQVIFGKHPLRNESDLSFFKFFYAYVGFHFIIFLLKLKVKVLN